MKSLTIILMTLISFSSFAGNVCEVKFVNNKLTGELDCSSSKDGIPGAILATELLFNNSRKINEKISLIAGMELNDYELRSATDVVQKNGTTLSTLIFIEKK